MSAVFFDAPEAFRQWLATYHDERDELWVGYYKKATGKPTMTWSESVDEALCFGWIDGIRKSIDDEAYKIRFTPRRRDSHWSRVNLDKAATLIDEGKMMPAGLTAFEGRNPSKSHGYSFERDDHRLTEEQESAFRARSGAWQFWDSQPAGYRKQATWWVISAKREETRTRRLRTLIDDSAKGLRIKQLRRG